MLIIENCNSLSEVRQKLIDGEEVRTVRQEPCEDVPDTNVGDMISRQAAIEAECATCSLNPPRERGHNCRYYVKGCPEVECLRNLPSAQPQPCIVNPSWTGTDPIAHTGYTTAGGNSSCTA